jgi:hypothetical protein
MMRPFVGFARPLIIESKDVLPTPESPVITTKPLVGNSKDKPWKTTLRCFLMNGNDNPIERAFILYQ